MTGTQAADRAVFANGLGSTTGLADGSGNVTASYGYDVFGALRSQSGTSDTIFKFTAEQRDSESGFYYLRARYYDPDIGRFLSQDPLPGGNLYAYVGSNPVNLADRAGLGGAVVGGGAFDLCTPFSGPCIGGGGGGGGIIIIGGVVIVIGAAAGGIAVLGEEIAGLPGEAWGSFTSLFSKKGGKSEDSRVGSIKTMSAELHRDLCRLATLPYKSSVETDIRKRIKNIQDEYRHLGPTKKRETERIFKELVRDNPCNPDPNLPVLPPTFDDGSTGDGKE